MPAKTKQGKQYGLGAKGGGVGEVDLTVPSGSLCRVKRTGPQGLIKMGLLDSLDSLTGLVKTEHFDRVAGQQSAVVNTDAIKDFAKNAEAIQAGFALIDKVCVGVVVQPRIYATPLDDNGDPLPSEQWDPEKIYVDSVELDDKLFILQFVVGGTADLETFRKERAELVADVPNL